MLGYVCIALAFSWPLPLHIGSALTGHPGGDTGVYVWNQWVFQHEAVSRHTNPFSTSQILSLTDRVDLSQHNYTVFLNLLAMPLIPLVGVVASFNIVYLAATILTALCTYALVRRVTSASRAEAWLAGVAFAWCPALIARSTGHFSLVAAAPLPAFLLCLIRADRSRRPRDAALAGLCLAWAGFCDAYYAVYCLLIAGGYLASRVVRITFVPGDTSAIVRWTLNVLIVSVAGLVLGLIVGPGGRFQILGIPVSVRGLYTPVLLLTLLVLARIAVQLHPHVALARFWSPAAARALLIGIVACAGPLAPVIYGLGQGIIDGRFVSPPTLWRSSPRGVDLLALFEFNPNHPVARLFRDRQLADGATFPEYTAALSLVVLSVVIVAVWRAEFRPRSGWVWLTAAFAALSLGPFVYVAGVNTYIPGPWSLLRYVPIIDAARTPTRFSIVAALGLAILFAGALAALGRRYPRQRRLVVATVGIILIAELLPAPRTLYSASVPAFYHTIAADPRPVRVLQLPFGVRDGTFTAGDFSAKYLFYQTVHGKRLIGGYLSRISQTRVRDMRRAQPTLDALVMMSEGAFLSPPHAAWIRSRGQGFISRANIGYVVVDLARTPPHLVEFVISAWDLERVAEDDGMILYEPRILR